MSQPSAVIFGAGNIGRGFIGRIFNESGYALIFVDIDQGLIDRFNSDGGYDLQTVFNDDVQDYRIAPVRGVSGKDADAVCELLCQVDLVATAVGVRALEFIAPHVARATECRLADGAGPMNYILCENLKDAASIFRNMVRKQTPAAVHPYLENQVGMVDPVIGCMVPPLTADMKVGNPTKVRVEPYKELPVDRSGFRGPIPSIAGMTVHDNFPVFTARKLYIHNCGHAVLAYAGYYHGYTYGWEAMEDPKVHRLLRQAWEESAAGIVHAYDADLDWLRAHMQDLDHRFRNKALGDTLFRLGRDPIRKLGPTDRLIAPAIQAMDAGIEPVGLATGIAMCLRFDHPDDPVAQDMQQGIARHGARAALCDAAELTTDHPLVDLIIDRYDALSD